MHGKPVFAPWFSGKLEFIDRGTTASCSLQLAGDRDEWFLVRVLTDVGNEPDLAALRTSMRRCYADRAHAAELGRKAKTDVIDNFSWTKCAQRFVRAVAEIVAVAELRGNASTACDSVR